MNTPDTSPQEGAFEKRDILPSSLPKVSRNVITDVKGVAWRPYFCASCGVEGKGGRVNENVSYILWLCDADQNNCSSKWQPLLGTSLIPYEKLCATAKAEQLETFGRELSEPELNDQLKDGDSSLSKLLRDYNSLPEHQR